MINEAKDYPPQIGGNHYDKYQIRYRDKGGAEDLQKAKWYLNELIALEATNGIATHT